MYIFRFLVLSIILLSAIAGWFIIRKEQHVFHPDVNNSKPTHSVVISPSLTPFPLPDKYYMTQGNFAGQTFNNCGPASLSITLSILGKNVSQSQLASTMRPFNNPQGGVDDKSIFAHEFVSEAKRQGFESLQRPNGTTQMIKQFVSKDIPVVVRTWLNDAEDIGHFRVVTGFDSLNATFTYQDSYYGPNQVQSEKEFNVLWQPFNYGYIIVYPKNKQEIVEQIIGENMDEKTAYKNALKKSEEELKVNSNNPFAYYNLATAHYYLENYDKTIEYFENSLSGIPPRMLWYQPEPIYAYQKLKQYDTALSLADGILNNGNLAYSELYQIKGEIYLEQGDTDAAREMFEKAVYYNSSFQSAKDALANLQ